MAPIQILATQYFCCKATRSRRGQQQEEVHLHVLPQLQRLQLISRQRKQALARVPSSRGNQKWKKLWKGNGKYGVKFEVWRRRAAESPEWYSYELSPTRPPQQSILDQQLRILLKCEHANIQAWCGTYTHQRLCQIWPLEERVLIKLPAHHETGLERILDSEMHSRSVNRKQDVLNVAFSNATQLSPCDLGASFHRHPVCTYACMHVHSA